MKKLLYILTVALSSWLMTACKKEAKLTPTPVPENVRSEHDLPQGDHPYDADIQQLFDKYHTLFLYKYTPNDIYFNVSVSEQGIYDSAKDKITKPGWFDVPADQQYVGQQLAMLKEIWLNYYPDSLLRKGLPQKVYLLDSFYFAALPWPYTGHGKPSDYINTEAIGDGYAGGDFIIATWGGSRITSITPADKYQLKGRLNSAFLASAHKLGIVKVSTAFTALTDYSEVSWATYLDQGVIGYYYAGDWYLPSNPDADWDKYVDVIVSNSYDVLTSSGNILSPDTDTKGVYKKKYDVVINYFKTTFGIDLQAIGNAGL